MQNMKVLRLEHTEDLSHLVQTTKVLREKIILQMPQRAVIFAPR